MKVISSEVNHVCRHCNNYIPSFTYRLQQHRASEKYMKHGSCCATCVAPGGLKFVSAKAVPLGGDMAAKKEIIVQKDIHRTNILYALAKASAMEKQSGAKISMCVTRTITAGRVLAATGLTAGVLFLYYEMVLMSVIFSCLGVVGLGFCILGLWKKFRIDKY